MNYKKFTKAQAKAFVDDLDSLPDAAWEDIVAKWTAYSVDDFDPSYSDLRDKIVEKYKEAEPKGGYAIDLSVGLCLYEELSLSSGFTNVVANDDDVWRYLSCKVFPDITYMRYPKPAQIYIRVNQKRFYSHPRRIWLKTLWWYVHLSWQGSKEATYMVLKSFGTDTISDFIERPGKGYRLGLFRELIKAYSHVEKKSSNLFNIIATQNRVNCTTVEPALTSNGEAGYVSRLFSQLNISGGEKHAC